MPCCLIHLTSLRPRSTSYLVILLPIDHSLPSFRLIGCANWSVHFIIEELISPKSEPLFPWYMLFCNTIEFLHLNSTRSSSLFWCNKVVRLLKGLFEAQQNFNVLYLVLLRALFHLYFHLYYLFIVILVSYFQSRFQLNLTLNLSLRSTNYFVRNPM